MNKAWDSHANVWFISSSSKSSLLNGMKILWDLKILWEMGSRSAKILWDFVSQCEVWHVCYWSFQILISILENASALDTDCFKNESVFTKTDQ